MDADRPDLQRALVQRVLETATPDGWRCFEGTLFKLPLTIPGQQPGFLHVFYRAGAAAWTPDEFDLHDHATDFASTVVVGRVVQRVYVRDAADGEAYEVGRAVGRDVVASGEVAFLRFAREEVVEAGQTYRQIAEDAHWTCPDDGTVTLLQRGPRANENGAARWFRPRSGAPAGEVFEAIVPASRPTADELAAACACALALF